MFALTDKVIRDEDRRMKEIAVVIPIYNGEKLLADCVKSVSAAGNRISEIIIVSIQILIQIIIII